MESEQQSPQETERYTEKEMFERLRIASSKFNNDMNSLEVCIAADALVEDGILGKRNYTEGPHNEDIYFVDDVEHGNVSSYRVLTIERVPDFHTGKGWKESSFTVKGYDDEGRVKSWLHKDSKSGRVLEKGSQTFFPNGNPQREEIFYDKFQNHKKEVLKYSEDNPKEVIYHEVTDNKTQKTEILVDSRKK